MILKNGKRVDGCSDTVPVGTINPYIGSIAPYGYLVCEGQLVSKTTYKELYEICGDKFGTGTETEFRLPDLRGKTIAGYKEGDTLFGTLGGLIGSLTHLHSTGNHTLTTDEMPSHYHDMPLMAGSEIIGRQYNVSWADNQSGNQGDTVSSGIRTGLNGKSQPHNHGDTSSASNIQPTVILNWVVKAFLLMPNQSYVENSLTSMSEINSLSAAKGKELNDKFNNYLSLNGGLVTNTLVTGKIGVGIDDTPGWSNSQLLIQASQNGETKTFKPAIGFVELGTSDGTLYMRNRSLYWMSGAAVSNHIPTANTGYELIHTGNYPLINDYSKETIIGYWVDGRPVYRKTIQLGANTSTNQVRSWTVGATNLNTVVDMRFVVHNNANQWRTIPWLYQSAVGGSTNNYGGADWAGGFYFMDDRVTIQLGTSVCTWSEAYFTIEYTKV